MKLGALVDIQSFLTPAAQALRFRALRMDSRAVQPGDVFVALAGTSEHGISYAAQAIARGAIFVLSDACDSDQARAALAALPAASVAVIAQLRGKLPTLALALTEHAAHRLHTIGVTGTNGKTTITQLLARALQTLTGKKIASIGTLGCGFIDALQDSDRTTPDVLSLHQAIAQFLQQDAGALVMEVSSHALVQNRVAGLQFKGAIFSNLTRDHLDYHGSMQAYAAAKALLFQWPSLDYVILNADAFSDPAELAQFMPHGAAANARVLRYSLHADRDAELYCSAIKRHARGSSIEIHYQDQRLQAELALLGEFNISNALAVVAALIAEGYNLSQLATVIAGMRPVRGRMNALHQAGCASVVIDYAHTPDALEKALRSLRLHVPDDGALICVFGCGGDRDVGKRPMMGAIAARLADRSIITSDNPRSEAPEHIAAAIMDGVRSENGSATVELNRQQAITLALHAACANDVILIAGKGHESYQEIAGVRYPFDDYLHAQQAMQTRGAAHAA
jgi:UDP-N-acetylmuramoyl-L-alanyl-D-glutamate--2,6-diaminopimelate ligase